MATTHANPAVAITAGSLVAAVVQATHTYAKTTPRSVTLKPAATISVGGAGVTVATGLDIAAGAIVTLVISGDLYAIAPVATTCKVILS